MNHLRPVFSLFLLIFVFAVSAFSQAYDPSQKIEPSYEVALQVVIGSNEAGQRGGLPANLSGISKQLRDNFTFTNYRLANTFLGRIANTSNIEYKSVSNVLGQETDASQTFLEWSLANFRSMQNGYQARSFRFGARVPVQVGSRDEAGRVSPVINYESVGLTVGMIGLQPNTPTLIGTISLPKTSGTIFLVATIKPTVS